MPIFTLQDGGQMHYQDIGSGQPILLVHGFGMGSDAFYNQYEISDNNRLIIPDLRGCGKNYELGLSNGSKPLNINSFAEDIFELIDGLELKNIVYVGWSMGALILWHAATNKALDNISKFVAIDMSPKVLNENEWHFGLIGSEYSVKNGHMKYQIDSFKNDWAKTAPKVLKRAFAKDIDIFTAPEFANVKDKILKIAINNDGEVCAQIWYELLLCDARDGLEKISIPTLLAVGAKSMLYSLATHKFVNSVMTNSEIIVFDNSGHSPHIEEYKKFNSMISDFARIQNSAHQPIQSNVTVNAV